MRNELGLLVLGTLLIAAAPAAADGAKTDFDQGVDVSAVVRTLRDGAGRARALPRHVYGPAFSRTERDCASIVIRKDDPTLSEAVTLESREYQERCYPSGPHGGQHCHDEWVRTERRHVRVEVLGRGAMLPWERDVFEVCLDGWWLSARVVDASHAYSIELPDWRGDIIKAVAGRKTPSLPDPSGIIAASFRFDPAAGNFALDLQDRWHSYYRGETTVLSLKLVRYHRNWFDETVLEKEIALPAAEAYSVRFADYAQELGGRLKAGKKYYVKWRFKRAGSVSKDKWTASFETGKETYSPGSSVLAAAAPARDSLALGGACFFEDIEKDMCVYRCRDGSEYRSPIRQPSPHDPDPGTTIPCPQIVFPF